MSINPYQSTEISSKRARLQSTPSADERAQFAVLAGVVGASWLIPIIGLLVFLTGTWIGAEYQWRSLEIGGILVGLVLTAALPSLIAYAVGRRYGPWAACGTGIWLGIFLSISMLIDL